MPVKNRIEAKVPAGANAGAASTRDQLIEAGLALMRKHGYGATGLQEILQSSKIPKGSFYHYFGSKEEFAAAVLERYGALNAGHCRKIFGNKQRTPLKRLRRYFEELIRMAGQSAEIPGCLAGSFSLEVSAASPLLQGLLSNGFARWQSDVAGVLREAQEAGDLPAALRPEPLAGFILNSWEGALLRSQADKSDAPLKEFMHFIFERLLAG